jgi:short-subunit dehydrogenase
VHVAITGASSGIGEALAREFARSGAKTTIVARRKELLDKLAAEIGGAFVVSKDLSDPATSTDWIEGAEAANGPIDVLVNNAGVENTGPFEDSDAAAGSRVLRTNLDTPLVLMRRVLPAMVARGSGGIVNVASVAAIANFPLQSWYSASKAGLAAASEVARWELRGTGVHVLTVYPGPVKTPMGDHAYEVFGGRKGVAGLMPEGRPEVLAARVRRALERRKARVIYPRFYTLVRWMPWLSRSAAWVIGPKLRAEAKARAAKS